MTLRESFAGVYDPLSPQFEDPESPQHENPYLWMQFPTDIVAICWELEHIHPVVRAQKSRLTPTQKQSLYDLLLNTDLSEQSNPNAWPQPVSLLETINVALTGENEDEIPFSMSQVVGRWIGFSQHLIPGKIQNTKKWKKLLVQAVGTNNNLECQRLQVLMDWMWEDILPLGQIAADKGGFGDHWHTLLALKSQRAADLPSSYADSDEEESPGYAYMAAFCAMKAASYTDEFIKNPNCYSQQHWLHSAIHSIFNASNYIEDACALDNIPFANILDWYGPTKRLIAADKY